MAECVGRVSVDRSEASVFHIIPLGDQVIASSCSNGLVTLWNSLTLERLLDLPKQTDRIIELQASGNLLFVTNRSQVSWHDCRIPGGAAGGCIKKTTSDWCSGSLVGDGNGLILGTEEEGGEGAVLAFDLRSCTAPFACSLDLHSRDVTCISMLAESQNFFVTAGEDGLCTVCEISRFAADGADFIFNAETAISRCSATTGEVYIATTTEQLIGCNLSDQTRFLALSAKEATSADCIVDVKANDGCLYLGTYGGNFCRTSISPFSGKEASVEFSGVHRDVVRCVFDCPDRQVCYSGGDDGVVAVWKYSSPRARIKYL